MNLKRSNKLLKDAIRLLKIKEMIKKQLKKRLTKKYNYDLPVLNMHEI